MGSRSDISCEIKPCAYGWMVLLAGVDGFMWAVTYPSFEAAKTGAKIMLAAIGGRESL